MDKGTRQLKASDRRSNKILTIDIGGGYHVTARKLDMPTMLFEGLMPLPVMNAAQKMVSMPDATPFERIAAMTDVEKNEIITLLRRHAIKTVLDPILTEDNDGNHDHLCVKDLSLDEFMAIWNETAVQTTEPSQAALFRGRPAESPAAPAQPREDVRPASEPLAPSTAVEFHHA